MKTVKFLQTLFTFVIVIAACTENDPDLQPTVEGKPEPTMVGFPIGIAITKTIGAGGGTIAIEGKVEISIPAGALSADTDISILPLTNNAPNGNGNAYRFGPEGTKFNKPVKVTFPYNGGDGIQPVLTGIAFQDMDGIWYSTGKFTWDEVNKKVSTETLHFSDWATFDHLAVRCDNCSNLGSQATLNVNENADLIFYLLAREPLSPADDLTPLIKKEADIAWSSIVKEWLVNGEEAKTMGQFGKIAPNSNGSVYTAPASRPKKGKNPVGISVKLKDLLYKDPVSKKDFKDLQLFVSIEIIGAFKYNLSIKYFSDQLFQGGLVGTAFTVTDSASLRVVVEDETVTCSDFVNGNGDVVPTTKNDAYNNKSTWKPDGFAGPFTITGGSGFITNFEPGDRTLALTLTGTAMSPAFEWVAFTGDKTSIPSQTGSFSQVYFLDLQDSIPTFTSPTGVFIVKMIPIE